MNGFLDNFKNINYETKRFKILRRAKNSRRINRYIMQLSQVKQTFTEENFKRIYGDIQLEDYLYDISSRFNKDFDVDCFYFAVFSFINFGGFTTKVFYKKFLEGSEYQDFKDWFKKDVERKYLEKLLN